VVVRRSRPIIFRRRSNANRFVIAAGTNLEASQCPIGSNSNSCMAAFLSLHLTKSSTAYLEVAAFPYSTLVLRLTIVQGTWIWLADHDLDGDGSSRLTAFSGRGVLSESAGPVWLIGTACKPITTLHQGYPGRTNPSISRASYTLPIQPSRCQGPLDWIRADGDGKCIF
jgi:hypothetical protein